MATILEGLNAISQAVGGAGEAESNLEALNQISEALGGSADATENAEAVANIAENASGGGGGGSALKTVPLTLEYKSGGNIGLDLQVVNEGKLEVVYTVVRQNIPTIVEVPLNANSGPKLYISMQELATAFPAGNITAKGSGGEYINMTRYTAENGYLLLGISSSVGETPIVIQFTRAVS